MLNTLALMLCGYLLGSIPFSFLVAKTRGVDLRTVGSGNTGASNVWRALGFSYFVVALVLDIFKGWLPTLLAHSVFNLSPLATIMVGICAMLGHVFPIFMGFRGGKAVATSGGVMLGFAPILTLTAAIVWTIVYKLFGYPSVASMVDAVVIALLATGMAIFGRLELPYAGFCWVVVVIVFYLHRANIQRLLRGQENRIGNRRRV
jgi:glycerol-3-phosphate acyltransferase PlsY